MKLIISLFLLCNAAFGFTVLIDPGHGGHDDGAKAKQLKNKKWSVVKEKDIALSLSKKIHYYLKKNEVNVYLTRSIDRAVSLEERAELADKIKADLFISVHINSSEATHPRGVETYYLDNHKDDVVKKIESIENKDLKGIELVVNNILTDLVIERTTKRSKLLASSIHGEIVGKMGKKYKLKDRGIRPGLFYVLALTQRPGILLEVGFLSNPSELKKMLNSDFQDSYARSVVNGTMKYINKQKKITPSLL